MILDGTVFRRKAKGPRPKAREGDHRCREWRIFHGRTPVDFDPTKPNPLEIRAIERQNEIEYRIFKPRMAAWRSALEASGKQLQQLLGR